MKSPRNFKLIREYPSSPKIGTIVTEDKLGQFVDKDINIFNKEDILNFPFFWEEIIEYCEYSYDISPNPTGVTRIRDNVYFNKGCRIKTPVSNSYCSIYDFIIQKNGELKIECTHSYLLEKAGYKDILDCIDICEYTKKDMINFATDNQNHLLLAKDHIEIWGK